jgi:hypothetical protein
MHIFALLHYGYCATFPMLGACLCLYFLLETVPVPQCLILLSLVHQVYSITCPDLIVVCNSCIFASVSTPWGKFIVFRYMIMLN